MKKKAVVLLSGGLDSATTLAIAVQRDFSPHTLSFDYGQRHRCELAAARRVAAHLGSVEHKLVRIDLRSIGGSALTQDIAVPKDRPLDESIPVTYVPARNTIFLSVALAWAEVLGSQDIFIGVNALDYSGYPDCRPEYLQAFQALADLATQAGVEGRQALTVHAPLISMSKAEIIRQGVGLGVDYALTHSCYDPDADCGPCGRCDSCCLRRNGFREAGLVDPLAYPGEQR
ncbi:MAG: 7-cyano-7-deazaguanine synthase QueC [Candidatus Methylomirabilia bacterium]